MTGHMCREGHREIRWTGDGECPVCERGYAMPQILVGGRWIAAVPEPYQLLIRVRCSCGAKFWTRDGYRTHYVVAHIWRSRSALSQPDRCDRCGHEVRDFYIADDKRIICPACKDSASLLRATPGDLG